MDQDSKLLAEAYGAMQPPIQGGADLYDLIYMARNLTVGDEEQTRIDDPTYLNALPSEIREQCEEKIRHGDYNGACEDFIRTVAAQKGITIQSTHLDKQDALWQAAEEVWKNLYGDLAKDEPGEWNSEDDIQSWFDTLRITLAKNI